MLINFQNKENNNLISFFEKLNNLKNVCEKIGFKGWDPYDGLNSPLIQKTFLKNNYFARLFFIQLFKKNPINLRKLFFIKEDYNPKALGLFLSGYVSIYKATKDNSALSQINFLAKKIIELITPGYSGACWGYNFDWQSRAFFLPKYSPTVVATSFIANALLDAYEITENEKYFNVADSSKYFILKDLNRTSKEKGFIFSYSPFDNTRVYNASLLGSKLLARIYSFTKEQFLVDEIMNSTIACVASQHTDGSWFYGELPIQNWIDSFHTGYNLECLQSISDYLKIEEFKDNIYSGFDFYVNNFIEKDGIPKYYHNKIYPIDIHCPCQFSNTIITLNKFDEQKVVLEKMWDWTIRNMYDFKKNIFYFQKNDLYTVKIPYIRWAQAWAFNSLSKLYNYVS